MTRLNGDEFAVNPDLIQRVEAHPDTVITLLDDTKYIVAESVPHVIRQIRDFRASVLHTAHLMDVGAYAAPVLEDPSTEDDTRAPAVLAFPMREER
ncbi:flagellar FlbD family protein [Goekera deserti]|uniref:flagellar FlbD family protein n=1 Tax=Goekera deserti TaxID=2497753 RepID=UPI001F44E4DB|nr:flagellar FlbD family protein [Goekera deserti]